MQYYMVGILGSGMRALANLLYKMGNKISGCDIEESMCIKDELPDEIYVEDIRIAKPVKSFVYIIGNTFVNHPFVNIIKGLGLTYLLYKEMIEKLNFNTKIAVCGTHGKTTTCNFIKTLGGMSSLVGDGTASYVNDMEFVYEACEYKNTFLSYNPDVTVALNVDYDHVDFFKTPEEYQKAFYDFINRSKIVIYNYDDLFLRSICKSNKYSFSIENAKAYLYCKYKIVDTGYQLKLYYNNIEKDVFLPLYGKHNIYNYLASYLTSLVLAKNESEIIERTIKLSLPKRRAQEYILDCNCLISDYAHHPNEILALFDFVNHKYSDYKKVIIYEGHTLSRSIHFISEIKKSLKKFDEAYLFPLFFSREEKSKKEKKYYRYLNLKKYKRKYVMKIIKMKKFVVIFAGAGAIDLEVKQIIKQINKQN